MKKLLIFFLLFSCNNNEIDQHDGIFEYSINIVSPNTEDKKMGDKMLIKIIFESGLKKTIHNINVIIYNKLDDKKVIYNKPFDSHIHGKHPYTFENELIISKDNGFYSGNWVLEVSVWDKKNEEAIKKKKEFSIL